MVRLLQTCRHLPRLESGRFNPTMVRLLPINDILGWISRIGFNPTMVRLLQDTLISYDNELLLFQSHNGAIAARPHAGLP